MLRRAALTAAIGSIWLGPQQPAAAAVDQTARRDDGSLIHWTLDRQHTAPKQGILVLAQGSGCLAATKNPNLERAKSLLPDFAVVTVEKYGVRPDDAPKDPFGGCSPDFYAHHTISQRVADYQRVLAKVETSPWWDGRLVLFGGSEGGAAVSMLAPQLLSVVGRHPGSRFDGGRAVGARSHPHCPRRAGPISARSSRAHGAGRLSTGRPLQPDVLGITRL